MKSGGHNTTRAGKIFIFSSTEDTETSTLPTSSFFATAAITILLSWEERKQWHAIIEGGVIFVYKDAEVISIHYVMTYHIEHLAAEVISIQTSDVGSN